MAGIIAIAVRKQGQVRTVHMAKTALNFMRDVNFLANPQANEMWARAPRKGDVSASAPGHLLAAPSQPLAPVQYGLVAIDFDRKWVGDLQNFTTLFAENTQTALAPVWRQETIALAQAGRCVLMKYGEDAGGVVHVYREEVVLTRPDGQGVDEDVVAAARRSTERMEYNGITPLDSVGMLAAKLPAEWSHDSFSTKPKAGGWPNFIEALAQRDWPVFDLVHRAAWRQYQEEGSFSTSDFARLESSWRAQSLQAQLPTSSVAPVRPRM